MTGTLGGVRDVPGAPSPSILARLARVLPPIFLAATFPFVTECSEGDGHLIAELGAGSGWVTWHAMPHGWVWLPDQVEVVWGALPLLALVLAVTALGFGLAEWRGLALGPLTGVSVAWLAAWLGTVLPLPFLFLGLLGLPAAVPAAAIGLIVQVLVRRSRGRDPPS